MVEGKRIYDIKYFYIWILFISLHNRLRIFKSNQMNLLDKIQSEQHKRSLINRLNFEKADQNSFLGQVRQDAENGMSEEDILEKARAGRYKDTPENRKAGKVGQKYGGEKKEEEETHLPKHKKESSLVKESSLDKIQDILYPLHSYAKGFIYIPNENGAQKVSNKLVIEQLKNNKTGVVTIFDIKDTNGEENIDHRIKDSEINNVFTLHLKGNFVKLIKEDFKQ